MFRFLVRRLLLVIPALFGLLVLTFVMVRLVPSDPAAALAGENATVEQIEEIRRSYGFDRPLYEQFFIYLKQVMRADFGVSMYSNRPVGADIALRLPATIELIVVSLVFAAVAGVIIGTLAAVFYNSAFDHIVRVISVGGLAVASFWFAIMLQLLFAMELNVLPLHGRLPVGHPAPPFVSGFYLVDTLLAGRFDTFVEALRHILLPAFTLSLGGLATIARFTRSAVLDTLQSEFVTHEKAVGYPTRRIIFPYVVRNSVVTPITQIGLLFGAFISGAVAIEAIFDWPGLGSYLVQAILTADYKAVLAVTLVVGVVYAFVNITIDLIHGMIDPRIADRM